MNLFRRRLTMTAFEVGLNGKKLCTAGIPEDGVVSIIASWAAKDGKAAKLHVGGIDSDKNQFVGWVNQWVKPGDKISIRVGRVKSVDKPVTKEARTNTREN